MSDSPAQPITGLRAGEVAEHVFLCGDPARVERISSGWKRTEEVCNVREYRIVAGEHEGVRMAAASGGIGAPGWAILVEELAQIGVRNLIRIGNSGGLAPELELGDLVISTGALRDDGTTTSYVPSGYPAVAHHDVVTALVAAARRKGARFATGVTWSLDAFYARNGVLDADGQIQPMSAFPAPDVARNIETFRAARVQNMEMESGVLLTLAGLFGLRAGCICVVSDRAPWPGPAELDIDKNMDTCIAVALDAMLQLVRE